MKNTEGIIKVVRKDKKGFQLDDGLWYSSFKELDVVKGDKVAVGFEFSKNGFYKNIEELKVLVPAPTFKPASFFRQETRDLKATTMLVSYAKDQVLAHMNWATINQKEFDMEQSWNLAIKCVMDAYNKVKRELEMEEIDDSQESEEN